MNTTQTVQLSQEDESNAKIGEQNDAFRKSLGSDPRYAGKVVKTSNVASLSYAWQQHIMREVVNFDSFDDDNDPYKTRDFGKFDVTFGIELKTFYWKIDLYDINYEYGSNQADDPHKTRRVLTVLFPEDY